MKRDQKAVAVTYLTYVVVGAQWQSRPPLTKKCKSHLVFISLN